VVLFKRLDFVLFNIFSIHLIIFVEVK